MKKMLSFILSAVMVVAIIPTSIIGSYSASPVNPFAAQDKARDKGLSTAIREFIPRDKNAKNEADAGSKGEKNSAVEDGKRFIVKFKESIPFNRIYDLLIPLQYKLIGNSKHRLFCIENASLEDLQKNMGDQVDYIEIDHVSKLDPIKAKRDFVEQDGVSKQKSITTNDPRLSEQWALDNTHIKDAWGVTTGGTDVLVAVIDSGIYREHEDFASTDIRDGWDSIDGGSVDRDSTGHGTNVAGIIAATANNNKGIAGVCWNIAIVPYLISYPDGTAFNSDIAGALHDAADAGVDVINISFGGRFSFVEQSATSYAAAKGCIVVASAGNDGTIAYSYPASYPGVISVASIDESSSRSYFSNYNNKIDVAAPGENILTTSYSYYSGYDYDCVDGTSFSSPYVAGIAALARSLDNTIGVYEFREILKETSTDKGKVGYDHYYGHGIINAKKIVDSLKSPVSPDAPTGLVSPRKTDSTVSLSWNAVPGATGYNVYDGSKLNTTPITTTTFKATGLSFNTTYTFTVTAVNSVGESASSAPLSVTTDAFLTPEVTLTKENTELGNKLEVQVKWYQLYKNVSVKLDFRANSDSAHVRWISDNRNVLVDRAGHITNTGIFGRCANIKVELLDDAGNVIATDKVKVIFYKFDWQLNKLRSQSIVSDNYAQRNLSVQELEKIGADDHVSTFAENNLLFITLIRFVRIVTSTLKEV